MAGKVLRKKILKQIAANGGEEWLHEQIASGVTVTKLAKSFDCSRAYMSQTLNEKPEYKAVLLAAREEAADAIVEEGLDIADALTGESSSNEISATRERLNWRKFMAGSLNQNKYGSRPQTNVTLSLGDMHLDALRKVNSELAAIEAEDRGRQESSIDAEYKDVTDE